MAARMGRGMFGRLQAGSPLTEGSWKQTSRTSITQVPPCAKRSSRFPAAVQSTPCMLEQACAANHRLGLWLWRNHQHGRLHVSYFDNIRTWYAVVACRPGGCMSLAGHSQVCLGGAKGYLTRGISWRSLRRPTAGLDADTGRDDESSACRVPLSRDSEVRWRCWSSPGRYHAPNRA
jgi:hypothetical protein